MKLLKVDLKTHYLEIVPELLEDLWLLEKIIEPGDLVKGHSTRSFRPKDSDRTERKEVFVELRAEKVELQEHTQQLRVIGTIEGGKPLEFVELHAHHSLDFPLGEKIKFEKKSLASHQIARLKKAEESTKREPTAIVVLDDEEATVGILRGYSFEIKASIRGKRHGKQFQQEESNQFEREIWEKLNQLKLPKIVIAGPGFEKEHLMKFLKEKSPSWNARMESINSVGVTGFNELITKGIAGKAAQEGAMEQEAKALESILKELGRNSGLALIGFDAVKESVERGAVEELLMTDNFLFEEKQKAESLIELAEQTNTVWRVVSERSATGRQLKGLGSVSARLRYKRY